MKPTINIRKIPYTDIDDFTLPRLVTVIALIVWLMLVYTLPAQANSGTSITAPDTVGNVGVHSSVALDSNGYPVISYYDVTGGNLKVMHCNDPNCEGGDESITSPDTTDDVGQYTSLVLDANGYPVISYYDATHQDMRVMHCNDANCAGGDESITAPDSDSQVGRFSSLKLDSSGNPVISYNRGGIADLRVMHCNDPDCAGGDESITSPDTIGDVGEYTSLELDSSGFPVVSYYAGGNKDVKLMHCNDVNCDSSVNGPESIVTVDSVGIVGQFGSLALDGNGYPVITYSDDDNGTLKLAHCNDPNCDPAVNGAESITAVVTSNVIQFTSVVVDSNGYPVVSYYDLFFRSVSLVHCNDANCVGGDESIINVDTVDDVGHSNSLVLDGNGYPVISYYDATSDDLKLAHCGHVNCEPNTSPTADAGGPYAADEGGSVQLDGSGSTDPHQASPTLTYDWDFDGDGQYNDASGINPTFSATTLDGPNTVVVDLQVTDAGGLTDTMTATVTVNNVAPAPNAGADQTVFRNDTVNLTGTWTDPAGAADNPYSWSWDLDGDGNADVSGSANNGDTINQSTTFAVEGVVTLTFTVGDKDGATASDTMEITVVNRAPVANNDAYTTNEDTFLTISAPGVLGNDTDDDGDSLAALLASGPNHGTVTLNLDGSFMYTPTIGFFGTDSFTYHANDGLADSNIVTVMITVNHVASAFATCGGYDVFETGPGVYEAPSFSGYLIVGTNGYDWIVGTSGPDLILGLGGPDDIWGKGDDDVICGGRGVDIIEGQGGNDMLYGDRHDDWLIGGTGDDTLYGGHGWDDLEGNGGQDTLYGEGGYDVLLGGGQSDWLIGGDGPDDLYGQHGADDLDGGNGNDYCKGGPGSDTIANCEGASSAALGETSADDRTMETADIDAARTGNDGDHGEHTISQRIKDFFLPFIIR